ncbi:stable inheritance protein KleA [Neorhizobium sp. IRAMC:178]|uniref:stable inheritance protein KleA n=1 Tax=Neorhizobium tunisiense TaxID=3144793 RepID=UPI0031F6431D
MSHWVDYLPEVGRPTQKLGEEQMRISAEIAALYKQIQALEQQHQKGKENLLAHVRQFWTAEEIVKAETQWGKEF